MKWRSPLRHRQAAKKYRLAINHYKSLMNEVRDGLKADVAADSLRPDKAEELEGFIDDHEYRKLFAVLEAQ